MHICSGYVTQVSDPWPVALVEVIIMSLAQNVCLDDFKVMYIFLSSDFLKFFCLGQLLVLQSDIWYL